MAASAPRLYIGSISAGEVMTLREAARRLGIGAAGMRQAQRAGLKCVPFGRQKFVLGADVLKFFEQLKEEK